jgi:hypothetical protein
MIPGIMLSIMGGTRYGNNSSIYQSLIENRMNIRYVTIAF